MNRSHIVAVAMSYDHFLTTSDGDTYDLSKKASLKSQLIKDLQSITTQIVEKAKHSKIVILSDIVTPYEHPTLIEPSWWYSFLSSLNKSSKNISIISDRGTIAPLCSSCMRRVPPYYLKPDRWICPHCKVLHDSTGNILSNILRTYNLSNENRKRLKSQSISDGKDKGEKSQSHLPYLFSTVVGKSKPVVSDAYKVTTDKKTIAFLRNMNRVCRHIRSEMVKTLSDKELPCPFQLNYKGWVDEWNDKHGKFVGHRRGSSAKVAALSVTDTIISICHSINKDKLLPREDDPVWVVYWRNVTVDKTNKRVALPRMRGLYLQLPDHAIIPSGLYYVEISAPSGDKIHLRFVMAGNQPPKYETIDGSHQRGKHRRNTREPRLKFKE